MDASIFWEVIGNYNQQTWVIQLVLMAALAISIFLALKKKVQWLPKLLLGISNLFIGIVYFLYYGTEPIQFYFAAPLYIGAGILLFWESIRNQKDSELNFGILQWILLILFLSYPFVSLLLGNSFPKMVVYIMPCPLISLSIIVYSAYRKRNKILLVLFSLWGLTGVKAFFFNAFEDIILLLCGLFCVYRLVSDIMKLKKVLV